MSSVNKTGVYLIGAHGSIASTVVAGALALKKQLVGATGMVTRSPIFEGVDLVEVSSLVFGGCDIRRAAISGDIFEKMPQVAPSILMEISTDLEEFHRNIDCGCTRNCGEAIENLADPVNVREKSLEEEIDNIRDRLRSFRRAYGLDEVIVVNLASTEPPLKLDACHCDFDSFRKLIACNETGKLRASTLYSYAAILEGCPYINFTPSNAALIPAVLELATQKRVPVMGDDGKTGETLVKSVLAPMFAWRNLEVMSWEGFNILGNMDGRVLDNPENRESKIRTKDQVLSKILGYSPHSSIGIDYVPSLDDQKTAWDFIHFRGFLGAKMSLQFIWQGYDSILAAPLVLDLARLAELAKRRFEAGPMTHLASFFKAPIGVDKYALADQFLMLAEYAETARRDGSRFSRG